MGPHTGPFVTWKTKEWHSQLSGDSGTEMHKLSAVLIVSWLYLVHANRTGLQKMVQETLTGYQIPGRVQQMVN